MSVCREGESAGRMNLAGRSEDCLDERILGRMEKSEASPGRFIIFEI